MITTKEVKIKIKGKPTSGNIENELASCGYNVLRWAITSEENGYYLVNIAAEE